MSKFSIWDPGWSWWTSVREADKDYKHFWEHLLYILHHKKTYHNYGHHIFGQIKQDENKTIDKFVVWLGNQTLNCEYGGSNKEQIRDQVIN